MWSGGSQAKLLEQFERRRLLPFDAIRIHRIQQIHRHPLHHFVEHAHAAVEVGFQLAGDRAVVERLRQLAPGNFAVGNQHQAVQSAARGVRGHRRGSVSGRSARHPLVSRLPRERRRHGHARIFERAGRIHPLMFGEKLLHARALGAMRQRIQRRIALAKRDDLLLRNLRQDFAKPPDSALVSQIRTTSAGQAKAVSETLHRVPQARALPSQDK